MNKLIFSSLFAALFLFGCSKPTPSADFITYRLNFDDFDDTPFPTSMIADSISYIDLESTPECLIGEVTGCGFCDSGIVVFDRRGESVFLFSDSGKFLRAIGSKGQGPGEYIRPEAVDVDRNTIYVYDGIQGSILKYALDGSFVGADSVGRVDDFVHCSSEGADSYLVALCQEGDDRGFYLVTVEPYSFRKIVGAVDDTPGASFWNFFRFGEEDIAMMPNSFDNRVYQWKSDSINRSYLLDITPMPSSEQVKSIVGRQKVDYFNRMTFFDSPRWLLVNYWRAPEDYRTVIIDKNNDSVHIHSHMVNDLDSLRRGYVVKAFHDGAFIFALDDPETDSNPRLQLLHLKN